MVTARLKAIVVAESAPGCQMCPQRTRSPNSRRPRATGRLKVTAISVLPTRCVTEPCWLAGMRWAGAARATKVARSQTSSAPRGVIILLRALEVERISQVLELPVVIERGAAPALEPQASYELEL